MTDIKKEIVQENTNTNEVSSNFIHNIIDKDLENQKYGDKVLTRFPPEPNGYLHIGHAKAICLNFTTAMKYGGNCNLRYDDTNPVKEDMEFVNSIEEDVRWLGFEWAERLWASEYFDEMYDCAVQLINEGKAFVCDLNADVIRA
jgi:glutaminyl-tRNA synthetase